MRHIFGFVMFGVLSGAALLAPAQDNHLGMPVQPITHRVMAIGDSITMGAGANGGYRSLLENKLKSVAYKFIFVGHSMENSNGMSFRRHEGHSGWQTTDFTNGRADQPALGKMSSWLTWSKPDTLLIMTGTNDPTWIPKQDWTAKYQRLLDQVFAFDPKMRVVMISIPKSDNSVTGKATAESICYDIVKSVVANRKARGFTIEFADAYSTFDSTRDLSDPYHPNESGYQKIANAAYNALLRF